MVLLCISTEHSVLQKGSNHSGSAEEKASFLLGTFWGRLNIMIDEAEIEKCSRRKQFTNKVINTGKIEKRF